MQEFIQHELTAYIEGTLKQRMESEKDGSLGNVSMTAIQLEALSEVKRQLNGLSTVMNEQKMKPKIISYYRASHEQGAKWSMNFESRGGGPGKKGERAEQKILGAGFTAPGISRHGWGTDFDIESTDNAKFKRGKQGKQYDWLNDNAKHLGFCQPYKGGRMQRVESAGRKAGIGEERWHWSYYPVSQALLDLVTEFPNDVQERLNQLWQTFSDKKGVDMFQHVSTIWQDLHLNVAGNPFLQ